MVRGNAADKWEEGNCQLVGVGGGKSVREVKDALPGGVARPDEETPESNRMRMHERRNERKKGGKMG